MDVGQPGSNRQVLINVSALSGRAFLRDREVRQGSPGAFDKAVWRWPLAVAADAGGAEGILIMGFLSCTELLMDCWRNISMPQLDHVVSRAEHSTGSVRRASGYVQTAKPETCLLALRG